MIELVNVQEHALIFPRRIWEIMMGTSTDSAETETYMQLCVMVLTAQNGRFQSWRSSSQLKK